MKTIINLGFNLFLKLITLTSILFFINISFTQANPSANKELITNKIDFGKKYVFTTTDSIFTDFMINNTDLPVNYDTIFMKGVESKYFTFLSSTGKFSIGPGNKKSVRVKYTPEIMGHFNAELFIANKTDTIKSVVSGYGIMPILSLETNDINMGKVEIDESKDTLSILIFTNKGNAPLNITDVYLDGVDKADFLLISGLTQFTLQPDEQTSISVRFNPKVVGVKTAKIVIKDDYNTLPTEINLSGEAIIIPRPPILTLNNPIDLKQVNVGVSLDSLGIATIYNNSKQIIKIDKVEINGFNKSEFKLLNTNKTTLLPKDTLKVDLQFKPTINGNKTTYLDIFTELSATPIKILIKGNGYEDALKAVSVKTNLIQFDKQKINRPKDSLGIEVLINSGASQFAFSNIKISSGTNNFTIKNKAKLLNIIPNQNLKVDFTFEPQSIGIIQDSIIFYFNNNLDSIIVNLAGTGVERNSFATISGGNISGFAGETIELPIILNEAVRFDEIDDKNVSLGVYFNHTLLYPTNKTITVINDTLAKVNFDILLGDNMLSNQILDKLSFKVGLGNRISSPISFDFSSSNTGILDITFNVSKFDLLGICNEGGQRLMNPNNTIFVNSIKVDKDSKTLNSNVNLIETGQTKLLLYNINGEIVKEILDENILNPKEIEINIEIDDLSKGCYFLTLITPTYITTNKLLIE